MENYEGGEGRGKNERENGNIDKGTTKFNSFTSVIERK